MKARILLIIFFIAVSSISVLAENITLLEEKDTCIYFFYGTGCPHCTRVEPLLSELQGKYENLDLRRFEVYQDRVNSLLLKEYFQLYQIPEDQQGVPAVFIAGKYFIGDTPILQNLESEIINNPGAECPALQNSATGIAGETSPLQKFEAVSLITVVGAALVDSINPCAIAVLLILLASMFLADEFQKAKRALKAGFMFILSIYIVYFLFGIGLFAVFRNVTGVWGTGSSIIKYLIGFFAIALGLFNLKDYFWYGAGFTMEIPRRWRPKLRSLLKGVTSPSGAFLAGFLVSAFELPCTGGPYFFAIGYLSDKATYASIVPILLLYNLIFVLPLIVINLMLYYGVTSIEKAEQWKQRNIRKLHLVAGLIMLLLGIIVVSGVI